MRRHACPKETQMARTHRLSTTALLVCLVSTQWSGTLFAQSTIERSRFTLTDSALAATAAGPAGSPRVWRPALTVAPAESGSLAQRGWWGRGRGGRNGGARTAVILGSVAAIAGAAVLVYANRPECRANETANACGYGTKVIGGAVLSAGAVGIVVGALTWR
jgi:hypothetical protein